MKAMVLMRRTAPTKIILRDMKIIRKKNIRMAKAVLKDAAFC